MTILNSTMNSLFKMCRMFYTENQKDSFLWKALSLFLQYFKENSKDYLSPEDYITYVEEKDEERCNEIQKVLVEQDDLYIKSGWMTIVDMQLNNGYAEEIIANAPEETQEKWFMCDFAKSLLYDFIRDEDDAFKINRRLTNREIAHFTYYIYTVLVQHIKTKLNIDEELCTRMLDLLNCGEYTQNKWCNFMQNERFENIRPCVTRDCICKMLLLEKSGKGMDSFDLWEYVHEEIERPVYIAIHKARFEVLEIGRKFLDENTGIEIALDEFYQYVTDRVDLDLVDNGEPYNPDRNMNSKKESNADEFINDIMEMLL